MQLSPSWCTLVLVLLLGVAAGSCGGAAADLESGPIPHSTVPTEAVEVSAALLELAERTYAEQCAACHGADGAGEGEAAYLLYPKPRDFTRGSYRLVSTWEGVPTDADLFRTISRGMPGSGMPSWAHLPERTRWALVHYLKRFSRRDLGIRPASEPPSFGAAGTGVVHVPPEPRHTPASKARAWELYAQGCAPCHGATGAGDGLQEQFDTRGFPTRPRDLTAGIFKGSPAPAEVYRRLVAGLPGSPMPQSGYLHGDDAWHLVELVRSLSTAGQRARVEMKQHRIVAARVPELPAHPDSGRWRSAAAAQLHLMPLWWRDERPERLTVKAAHDGRELAILLRWTDATHDATVIRTQDFRDAAAIQFSMAVDPPFLGMGTAGEPVDIWMWKSERQADLEPAFQDLEKVYPHIGIDSYPNLLHAPVEQPLRHALTLESDPSFITAWGAGNIVADPTRESAAEDLTAEGFGTLRARPAADQAVTASGEHLTGSYRVQFVRALDTGRSAAISPGPGDRVSVAFAVWDGSAGDRDGKKSITIWHELWLER